MKVSETYPTPLTCDDLRGKAHNVVISNVSIKTFEDNGKIEKKFFINFQNRSKGLVANKTNCNYISGLYGDETDNWIGKEIVLYPARVQFGSKMVDAIRVRGPKEDAVPVAPQSDNPDEEWR